MAFPAERGRLKRLQSPSRHLYVEGQPWFKALESRDPPLKSWQADETGAAHGGEERRRHPRLVPLALAGVGAATHPVHFLLMCLGGDGDGHEAAPVAATGTYL